MPDIEVLDSGPALHLFEIGQLAQFKIFPRIFISGQVEAELDVMEVLDALREELDDQLCVEPVSQNECAEIQKSISHRLQLADLSVVVLAGRLSPEATFTDDLDLRETLEGRGHRVVGSLGILIRSFKLGRLSLMALRGHLDDLFDDSSLYFSKALRETIDRMLEDESA